MKISYPDYSPGFCIILYENVNFLIVFKPSTSIENKVTQWFVET
jgi:hypothetical protein